VGTLLDLIKLAGVSAVDAGSPVQLLYGNVTAVDPIEVNVDQRFTLTAEFLVLTEQVTRMELDLKHTHVYEDASDTGTAWKTTAEALEHKLVIRPGLQEGDAVLLLRMQGGQKYVILDKVVSA